MNVGIAAMNRSRVFFGPFGGKFVMDFDMWKLVDCVDWLFRTDEQRERVFEEGLRCGRVEAI
jgi:hypothetical protein